MGLELPSHLRCNGQRQRVTYTVVDASRRLKEDTKAGETKSFLVLRLTINGRFFRYAYIHEDTFAKDSFKKHWELKGLSLDATPTMGKLSEAIGGQIHVAADDAQLETVAEKAPEDVSSDTESDGNERCPFTNGNAM